MKRILRITSRSYESILDSWKEQNHLTACEGVFGGHEYAYIGNNIWIFRNGRAIQLDYNNQSYDCGTWSSADGSITFDNDFSKTFSDEHEFYNVLETARFPIYLKNVNTQVK